MKNSMEKSENNRWVRCLVVMAAMFGLLVLLMLINIGQRTGALS